jgi:hypothetical protein
MAADGSVQLIASRVGHSAGHAGNRPHAEPGIGSGTRFQISPRAALRLDLASPQ